MIKEGRYYALQTQIEGFEHQKYIMLVLPKPVHLPAHLYRTQALAIHTMDMWQTDWIETTFEREATLEEIDLFHNVRCQYGETLPAIGDLVLGGIKIEAFEQTTKSHRTSSVINIRKDALYV